MASPTWSPAGIDWGIETVLGQRYVVTGKLRILRRRPDGSIYVNPEGPNAEPDPVGIDSETLPAWP